MHYSIEHLCPSDVLGGYGFTIRLAPEFQVAVARSRITCDNIHDWIMRNGERLLDACDYSGLFDPDNCGFDKDPKLPPGPNARRAYPAHRIRVSWGAWGPEHIDVPGNACGLDIGREGWAGRHGVTLEPHNVDCWRQVQLLLLVFTELASLVELLGRDDRYQKPYLCDGEGI